MSKKLQNYCGFAILVIATIALGAGVITAILRSDSENERRANVCSDKHCEDTAKEFLSNMDANIDPCHDFYKFACGNYPQHTPLPPGKVSVSPSSKISDEVQKQLKEILEEPIKTDELNNFKNVKKYYRACLNTDKIEEVGLKKVTKILESLGGWPVVQDYHPNVNWTSVLYKMKDFGMDVYHLIYFDVELQLEDSSKRSLMFSPPYTPAEIPPEELSKGKDSSIVKGYYDFTVELAKLFGANQEVAEKDMEDVLDLEIALSKVAKTREQLAEDISALNNRFTISQLEKEFPGFPWYDYINKMTPKNLTIPKSEEVGMSEPEYTRFLIEKLQETPQRVLRNLIILRALNSMLPYLNQETRMLQNKFKGGFGGDRWKECIFRVDNKLPIFENAMYARKYFNPTSKKLVTELIEYIKMQYLEILSSTHWSADDKKFAQEKIEGLHLIAGYPDELMDAKMLEELNADVEIFEDDYLQSDLNLQKQMYEEQFYDLYKKKDRISWKEYVKISTVNAYYSAEQNSFFLPAATLQGIYFDANRPKYTNFAAIGATIGHELSHAFDNVGHKFDKNGGLTGVWSDISNQEFAKRKACLINQFNQYTVSQGNKLNGAKTVQENLADLNGYNAAYLSYQKWLEENGNEPGLPNMKYNNNQLFWISAANKWCSNVKPESVIRGILSYTHAPNEFRVVGPLSNLEMFAKDFNCPIGSKMNPNHKCKPW